MKKEEIMKKVREGYGQIAAQGTSCCGSGTPCCCGSSGDTLSTTMGYTPGELNAIPQGADLGLGCGNPTALASLREGEVVLDLGSGAGIDCFLAARKVGKTGKVIGVDMTPQMLERARENAAKGSYENVEFRLGEIENLPVADNTVDVVISNCVINLSPDKKRVFEETYRVLKPGGRLLISDIVLLKELPDEVRNSVSAYLSCIAGAIFKEDYLATIGNAGFQKVEVVDEMSTEGMWSALTGPCTGDRITDAIVSIKVRAVK